ncbi:MAG: hypothetical protein H0A75_07885 [Candidatus Methanofishera endochildressiae]|uniref:Uncharacterized protein n=1 Tax=Candidatus Methanofishera endochildressiae TaxID=2738884 RepID=A0A7Z0MPI4_9GAMM|nr:hypothetical protein [Candidatus Methanofishera endochildressiae]
MESAAVARFANQQQIPTQYGLETRRIIFQNGLARMIGSDWQTAAFLIPPSGGTAKPD